MDEQKKEDAEEKKEVSEDKEGAEKDNDVGDASKKETKKLGAIERAEAANKKGEEIAERIEAANRKHEEIVATQILSGTTEAGAGSKKPEGESDADYAKRALAGEIEEKTDVKEK